MRNNLPISNIEYPITDETLIVSKTDLKGKLTYFNDQFIQGIRLHRAGAGRSAAQYRPASGHAAGSLRKSLGYAQGRQILGRRRQEPAQDGEYYWVLASATPIYEGGRISGYMSVRTRLPADQREEAEQVYASLRAQQASAYRIDAGMIRKKSVFDLFAVFTRSLKSRLATMVGTLTAATLVVGATGFLAMNQINQHAKSIYEDRTVPLAQLFEINDRMKENSLALYGAIANARLGRPVGDVPGRVAANVEAISKTWSDYMATYLTPEEKETAGAFAQKRGVYVQAGPEGRSRPGADGKYDELSKHMMARVAGLFADAKGDLDKLVAIQIKEAKLEYDATERAYLISNIVAFSILCVGLLIGGLQALASMRAIGRPARSDK